MLWFLACRAVRSSLVLDIIVDRVNQPAHVAQRSLSNEIAAKPTQLNELGLDRLGARFYVALALSLHPPSLRGRPVLCALITPPSNRGPGESQIIGS